jgi:putative nucleotidyltransferase with HDIG domain
VATSLTGAAGVSRSERAGSLVLAGVGAGAVGALAALALELFRGASTGLELVWLGAAAFTGGALSGLLLVVVVPIVEAVFGYVTEPRLFRLADLNRPLLKDLVVHAPGTWHHSVRTAELAEAAARAVGASPLLARTIALYHDVGKMKRPQLFAENQKGDNPHDRLPPEESADVLRAHVAEGALLAQEAGLPRAVTDAIEDHHADNLMETFAAKARAATEPSTFDEQRFRYRGGPPQSKEGALVMLADQIEGASRGLEDPTPSRLRELVEALVARAINDDTLGECDLSLRDLATAREALTRALLRLHRQEPA